MTVLRSKHPLVLFQRRNGRVEQVLVGPATVRLMLRLTAMIITAVLLYSGTLRTDDALAMLANLFGALIGP